MVRERATVLRFGCSTWLIHCNYMHSDAETFLADFGIGPHEASRCATRGGGVPIRVGGVEGVVAVVAVTGLLEPENHGVISEVTKSHWAPQPEE